MTKKRKIEILEIMKKEIAEKCYSGLCLKCACLFAVGKIISDEYEWLCGLIEDNKPRNAKAYYWQRGKKAPRINWINERIKELQ